MRHQRRVLLIAAPTAADPLLADQRRILAAWRHAAEDRDITVVEVVGNQLRGASHSAAELRREHRIPATAFAVVLIGKDGHEAMRSATPITAEKLQSIIDAMPMRRAGQR